MVTGYGYRLWLQAMVAGLAAFEVVRIELVRTREHYEAERIAYRVRVRG